MQKYFTKINIETKSIDGSGMFAGYASMFNVVDSMGDAILPGAFRETLKENQSIKLLWQHDATQPIGIITKDF
jgi:HK97 family phage prohead protease